VRPTIYVCSQIVGTNRCFWWTVTEDPEPLKVLDDEERRATLERTYGFTETRDYAERAALSQDEIRALAQWADFGAHTRFHPILPRCSDERARQEVAISRIEVEALSRQPCRHFSYPNGSYGAREIALVKEAGYASARTIDVGWNAKDADLFALKMIGVPDDASVNRLAASLAGIALLKRARSS
jgi:peptidoglycan/xylan/chitin deacetylase (PgdA/CDA1 family)